MTVSTRENEKRINAVSTQKTFQVIVRYHPKEGKSEAVLGLLAELAAASRVEPACLSFEYFLNPENLQEIVILESFISHAGFLAHRDAAHSLRINSEQILPLLESRSSSKGALSPL